MLARKPIEHDSRSSSSSPEPFASVSGEAADGADGNGLGHSFPCWSLALSGCRRFSPCRTLLKWRHPLCCRGEEGHSACSELGDAAFAAECPRAFREGLQRVADNLASLQSMAVSDGATTSPESGAVLPELPRNVQGVAEGRRCDWRQHRLSASSRGLANRPLGQAQDKRSHKSFFTDRVAILPGGETPQT